MVQLSLSFRPERSGVEEPRGGTDGPSTGSLDCARDDSQPNKERHLHERPRAMFDTIVNAINISFYN